MEQYERKGYSNVFRDIVMRLARREKYLVSLATFSVAIFLLLQFLIFPFFQTRGRLQRSVRAKEEGLKEILRLSSEYLSHCERTQGVQEILARRDKGFTLFSFLEKSAGDAGVKAHIKYMKPSVSTSPGPYKESLVEMKLEAITLQQLISYLYGIESPDDAVSIKRLSIEENRGKSGLLDAILQVLTFQ